MATLDGLQVKRYMENRPLPRFRGDLGTLLQILSNHHKAVNLILTKWDILEDHYTFRQVVERLLQLDEFAAFVESQRIVGVCRLIPVSSVGPGFVREDGNAMRKISGKVINPVRVEVPIACALPDALTAQRWRPGPPTPSRLLDWAKVMKLNLGLLQFDFSLIGTPPATTMTAAQSTPAAISQLVRYCVGRLGRLESDFPESDLVRFMYSREV